MANSSIFLTFHDLDSVGQANEVQIPCNSFNFDKSTNGGVYPKINIYRDLDGMSTNLFRAAATGAGFTWAEIEIDKAGSDGTLKPWNRITMTDGSFVSDLVAQGSSGSKTEVLVLGYHKLAFDDVHDANGQTTPPDQMGWDVQQPRAS